MASTEPLHIKEKVDKNCNATAFPSEDCGLQNVNSGTQNSALPKQQQKQQLVLVANTSVVVPNLPNAVIKSSNVGFASNQEPHSGANANTQLRTHSVVHGKRCQPQTGSYSIAANQNNSAPVYYLDSKNVACNQLPIPLKKQSGDGCHMGNMDGTTNEIHIDQQEQQKSNGHEKVHGLDHLQQASSNMGIVEGAIKLAPNPQVTALVTEKTSANNKKSSSNINLGDQKTGYGRLRVLAASPITGQIPSQSVELSSSIDQENQEFNSVCGNGGSGCSLTPKFVICQHEQVFGIPTNTIPPANRRSATSTNLRPSSSSTAGIGASTCSQRLSSGGTIGSLPGGTLTARCSVTGDHSVTQFALIDDENVSALQQETKGGGALTLASQWKSQFDDSEDTTDNEWKQEPQSQPNLDQFTKADMSLPLLRRPSDLAVNHSCNSKAEPFGNDKIKRYTLNIAGIEKYENLQMSIPHCWSEPAMGNALRKELEPPAVQQAAFDDTVYRMDIARNVCIRESLSKVASKSYQKTVAILPNMQPLRDAAVDILSSHSNESHGMYNKHRNSLPNVCLILNEKPQTTENLKTTSIKADFHNKFGSKSKNAVAVPWCVKTTFCQRSNLPIQSSLDTTITPDLTSRLGNKTFFDDQGNDGCVSGRLEIRVITKENSHIDESVYYDALAATHNKLSKSTTCIRSSCDNQTSASINENKLIKSENLGIGVNTADDCKSTLLTKEVIEPVDKFSSCKINLYDGTKATLNGNGERLTSPVTQIQYADSNIVRTTSRIQEDGLVIDNTPDGGCEILSCTPSKIPVLTHNMSQSKCASWAGVDSTSSSLSAGFQGVQTPNPDISNNPNPSQQYSTVTENTQNILDLTPGLRRRRESTEGKYVTDPTQLNLRFQRQTRYSNRARGIPFTMMSSFDDRPVDNSSAGHGVKVLGEDYAEIESEFCKEAAIPPSVSSLSEDDPNNIPWNQNPIEPLFKNDISPPPGDPKIENSARLRRYRHNNLE